MNYKLEKFWNKSTVYPEGSSPTMNYKLEKFWNISPHTFIKTFFIMNYKLEKFWNILNFSGRIEYLKWTINLKSFEINYRSRHY